MLTLLLLITTMLPLMIFRRLIFIFIAAIFAFYADAIAAPRFAIVCRCRC